MTIQEGQEVYEALRKARNEFKPLEHTYKHGKKAGQAATLRSAMLVMERAYQLIYKYPQVHSLATGGNANFGQASAGIMDDFKNINYFDHELGKLLVAIEKLIAEMKEA